MHKEVLPTKNKIIPIASATKFSTNNPRLHDRITIAHVWSFKEGLVGPLALLVRYFFYPIAFLRTLTLGTPCGLL